MSRGRSAQHARGVGHVAADRHERRRGGEVERAAECVHEPGAGQRKRSGAQVLRRLSGGCRGSERAVLSARAQQPAVVGEAQQLLADAVEAGRDDVELLDRVGDAGQRGLGRLVGLAARCPGRARPPRRASRGPRRRWSSRSTSSAGYGLAGCASSAPAPRPAAARRRPAPRRQPSSRSANLERDLPLEPQRHPGLRPRGHADRVGVGALDEREASQLIGDQAALKAQLGAAGRGLEGRRREGRGPSVVDRVDAEAQRRLRDQAARGQRRIKAPSLGGDPPAATAPGMGSSAALRGRAAAPRRAARRCSSEGSSSLPWSTWSTPRVTCEGQRQ